SLPIPTPALAPVLAVERWPSTMGTPILQWAPRHFCSTPAVRRTPPLELTRWSITMGAATTMLSAILRFLTTSTEPKTTLLATLRSCKTFTPVLTLPLVIPRCGVMTPPDTALPTKTPQLALRRSDLTLTPLKTLPLVITPSPIMTSPDTALPTSTQLLVLKRSLLTAMPAQIRRLVLTRS